MRYQPRPRTDDFIDITVESRDFLPISDDERAEGMTDEIGLWHIANTQMPPGDRADVQVTIRLGQNVMHLTGYVEPQVRVKQSLDTVTKRV